MKWNWMENTVKHFFISTGLWQKNRTVDSAEWLRADQKTSSDCRLPSLRSYWQLSVKINKEVPNAGTFVWLPCAKQRHGHYLRKRVSLSQISLSWALTCTEIISSRICNTLWLVHATLAGPDKNDQCFLNVNFYSSHMIRWVARYVWLDRWAIHA